MTAHASIAEETPEKSAPDTYMFGHANGMLKGGTHVKAPDGTPMANAMLSMRQSLGMNGLANFGDSNGTLNLRG